jgi:peptide/nickel transport system ATP-binding protein/oligopeptide transport system ATP-binding protein
VVVDSGIPLLACRKLSLGYPTRDGWKPVVHKVSFEINKGQTVALVGESGSGKSTIAKALVKLIPTREGSVQVMGEEVAPMSASSFYPYRKRIQLVFQDPWQALNPRLDTEQLLLEPLILHFPGMDKQIRSTRVRELLDSVHLPETVLRRFSSELSGGQRQRVLLARALAVEPDLLICDEPVSALDVSIQAQLLKLLQELKEEKDLTFLFISHDLAVVQLVADHVIVLQNGNLVESATTGNLFQSPEHPYTRMLIDACPKW